MGDNKILNQIYKYYPKNVSFNSKEYQNSPEYRRQMQKRKIAYNDLKYKQYLEKKHTGAQHVRPRGLLLLLHTLPRHARPRCARPHRARPRRALRGVVCARRGRSRRT